MPVSDDTILRHLKRQVARLTYAENDRTGGRHRRLELAKGAGLYGMPLLSIWSGARLSMCCRIAQPLREQPNGSVNTLRSNSSSRDRLRSLCAQGAREGALTLAPAGLLSRFHLLQNLRKTIETQLSRAD